MTYIEQGTTGAYRATWRKDNPRALLRTIMQKNHQADEKKIHNLFWREIEDDKGLLRACVEYWLDHNYRSLITAIVPAPTTAAARRSGKQATAQVATQLKQRVAHEVRQALLALVMPNEKRLGDCTGAECAKIGGWLDALAQRVPADKTVAATLTENQVFEIWRKANKR